MKPGETIRYACDDCQMVFDLTTAPLSERLEVFEDDDVPEDTEPMCCPFCAESALKMLHDRPEITPP